MRKSNQTQSASINDENTEQPNPRRQNGLFIGALKSFLLFLISNAFICVASAYNFPAGTPGAVAQSYLNAKGFGEWQVVAGADHWPAAYGWIERTYTIGSRFAPDNNYVIIGVFSHSDRYHTDIYGIPSGSPHKHLQAHGNRNDYAMFFVAPNGDWRSAQYDVWGPLWGKVQEGNVSTTNFDVRTVSFAARRVGFVGYILAHDPGRSYFPAPLPTMTLKIM